MVVTARSIADYNLFLDLFKSRGIDITPSKDLKFLGRVGADNQLLGAMAYTGFNGRTCSVHAVGNGNWVSRKFIRAAFEYPFITCNMVQLFGPVPGNNERALKFNRHVGFEVLTRIRYGWDDKTDLVIMGMHKSQCRWLTKEMYHVKGQLAACA
jgi:hypothetical protein